MNNLNRELILNRRDFLKISGVFSLGLVIPSGQMLPLLKQTPARPNVLIIVYDALSAHNVSLYGYPRETMPNLSRLAERSVVYHNHLAGGNFTTPGTASMFTGVYPWTHRAFSLNETVDNQFLSQNMFHAFPNHYRLAYTHNPYTNTLLTHLGEEIEDLIPPEKLFFYVNRLLSTLFKSDDDMAYLSWVRTFERGQESRTSSLFLSHFLGSVAAKYRNNRLREYETMFPRGVPLARGNYFLLEHATDFLAQTLVKAQQPFLGYIHFLPPHTPYSTRQDFYHRFRKDGFLPKEKPRHILSNNEPQDFINNMRTQYDEYLLYVDHEFARFYGFLEQSGLLKNTWIVFTSDHGEMFERGTLKHTTDTMYQPVIRVPMIIFEPGREQREDIFFPTSAIDLLPTLLQVTGGKVPDWCEGLVLPPYSDADTFRERNIYSMQIKKNKKYGPLNRGSIVMVKGYKKLVYYFGYPELEPYDGELIESYDLEEDPEEMRNLAQENGKFARSMLDHLKENLEKVNQPYLSK